MIENLIDVLSSEEEELKSLLAILEEQHKRILSNDLFLLNEIIIKIKECNKKIAFYELERKKILNGESLKYLASLEGNEKLDNKYRSVKKIAFNIKVQKDTNELLLKQNISYTNKVLNILTPREEFNVYNSVGQICK